MNAHNNFRRLSPRNFNARQALAVVRLRLAAQLDFLVARWLQRCATNIEVAPELFKADREPLRELRRA